MWCVLTTPSRIQEHLTTSLPTAHAGTVPAQLPARAATPGGSAAVGLQTACGGGP